MKGVVFQKVHLLGYILVKNINYSFIKRWFSAISLYVTTHMKAITGYEQSLHRSDGEGSSCIFLKKISLEILMYHSFTLQRLI